MAADFRWKVRRIRFRALDELRFPPHAGNALRGALGFLLEPGVFRPRARPGLPSGLKTPPPPFAVRAKHLDGLTVAAGSAWELILHIFDLSLDLDPDLRTVSGSRVVKLETESADHVVDLTPASASVTAVEVAFETPTELKGHDDPAIPPAFDVLFKRARDRVATLLALYGSGAVDIDFRALGDRAAAVRRVGGAVEPVSIDRYSTRTGQVHPLGGFRGNALYEGDLAEFIPWLRAAEAAGVGRHTVWGNGVIRITAL